MYDREAEKGKKINEREIHDIDNPKTPTRSKGMRRILTEGKLTDDEAAKALGFKDANEMRAKLLAAAEAKNK